MASLFQKIQERRKTSPLNVAPTKVVTNPVATSTPPVVANNPLIKQRATDFLNNSTIQKRNLGSGSIEGGPVKSTLATAENPVIAVSTKPPAVDIETTDMNGLLREQDAIQYKISTGNYTQEDYVRGREINRKLSETMYATPKMEVNPMIAELEAKAQALKTRDSSPEVDLRRQMLQAKLDTRKGDLQENARRARESTIGNIAMAGGGRSSVAQQAELDIQKELANQLNAEQAAMELEIMAYERQLAGATDEELSSINNSINTLKTQSAQSQMVLEQKNKEQIQSSLGTFDKKLQEIAQKQGIQLDVNDEAALQQVINISRNPDGSVNEQVVAGLPKEYQDLVRAGVSSGVGQKLTSAPKVERIGGTNKSPVYGYRDGQKFVTTNAQGVPTVRSGGSGGRSGGGSGGELDMSGVENKDKKLVGLMNDYKDVLSSTTYLGLQTDPFKKGELQNLESQIAAEYKKAEKLGALDAGVERLVKGLLGKSGTFSANTYNNQAQAAAIEGYIESKGGKINKSTPTISSTQNTKTPVNTTTPNFVGNSGTNRLKK